MAHLDAIGAHVADVGGTFDDELVGLTFDERADDAVEISDEHGHVEGFEVNLHLAGFDLGDVEDVVDEFEQVAARVVDAAQVFDPLLVTFGLDVGDEHLAEADDGGERRAQLVAHEGEEVALGLVRLLGDVAGLLQFGIALLDLREHVVEGFDECADFVAALADGALAVIFFLGDDAGGPREIEQRLGDDALEAGGDEEGDGKRDEQDDGDDADVFAQL